MDDIMNKMPVLKEFVIRCPLNGGIHPSFTNHLYFIHEIKPIRLFLVIYPVPNTSLKEWVIHSIEMFTSGINMKDKPNVEKSIAMREKFLVGINKVLRDLIPKTIVLPRLGTVFPKTSSHFKEHFVTLNDRILPSQFPRRVCLHMIKRSLENWPTFNAERNFYVGMEDVAKATERYPYK